MKIFFQFMIILLAINISFAQTNYYVDNTMGNDVPENGAGVGTLAWETIEYAINNVSNPTSEQIIINISTGIYDLSNDQIDIDRSFADLTLLGEGSDNTFIQSATDTSLSSSRVIKIYPGNIVSIKKLTIRYGRVTDPELDGGGILNDRGTLTIDYCNVTENLGRLLSQGYGSGIANLDGILTVNNSSITYNTGADSGQGAGIGSRNGVLNIYNSTISYNSTKFSGGGIAVLSNGANAIFNMENSTVFGNKAYNFGGIRVSVFGDSSVYNVTTNINSCTIFNNYAEDFYGGIGLSTPSNFNIKNSIVTGNKFNFTTPNDLSGTALDPIAITSGGYNILTTVDNVTINGEQNNGLGLDPGLLPLADNYSANGTQTCAIPENSPAKDQIPASSPNGAPLLDQRGYQRVGNYDIGAYEISNLTGLTAKVQVIQNSADITTDSVDVYINGVLAISDLGFRRATPFLDLSAGITLNIGIAPGNSTSVSDTLKNFPVVFTAGEKYVVFANGVLDTSLYAQNPDGRSTKFTLFVKDMAKETAAGSGVDLFVLHGSTDAPAVDIKIRELSDTTIVNNAAYGDITGYITAPAQDVTLDIYLANGTSFVSSFTASLSTLNGEAAAVFASGFLNPATNQNGDAFGLFAALPNGTVLQFPTAPSVIMVTPDTLTGFTYVDGFGPSISKSYSLSGINLTPADGDITVAGSNNYKVSTDNTTFSDTLKVVYTGGLLLDTTIYIRLKAGLSVGAYNGETISNTGGGATTQDITANGSVTSLLILPIDSLKENDADGVTKALNDTISTTGIVTSILQLGTGTSGPGTIQNANTAVSIYGSKFTGTPDLQMGDSIVVYNWKVINYSGLTELSSTSASSVEIISSGHKITPLIVTIPQIKGQAWDGFEKYEGMLLRVNNVRFVQGGTTIDVGTSSGVNYQIYNGVDTLDFRVVKTNTSLLGKTLPTDQLDIVGILQQYKSSAPYNSGYQLMPLDSSGIIERTIIAIDSLKENDADGVTKALNDTISTTGIVTSILQLGTGTSGPGTIQNANTAVSIYGSKFTGTPDLQMGDSIVVYNWKVINYSGLTELSSTSASSVEIISSGHTVIPLVVTIPQIKNEGWDSFEKYEAMFVQINDVKFVQSGKFDIGTSSGVNFQIFNGPDTLDFRVVKTNTSLIGQDIPAGTVQLTGIIQQYKSAAPYNAGYEIFPLDSSAIQIINGIADNNNSQVITYQLDQNYPNPFNPTTKIRFSIPQAGNVRLTVFNILGQEVQTLVNGEMAAGMHSVDFGASNLSSGVYIYRIEAGSFIQTRKMTLMK